MVKVSEVQLYVNKYNECCNKKKIKIPGKISKKSEAEMLEVLFLKWVNEDIKFTSSKDTLHPNLIRYLIKNKVCDIKRDKEGRTKGSCYLEDKKGNKVSISKQIHFGYHFIEKLRKYKKKNYIKDFFDDEGYVTNLKLEEWVRSWNGAITTRRLDFTFQIGIEAGNDKKIVVEYLEDHHANEIKHWDNYQSIRLVDIIFGHDRSDLVHFAFVWDSLMNEDYLNKKVNFFCKICKDHYNIENEEKYVINILNEHIGDKRLSKVFFDAYKNQNKPVLKLSDINTQFKVKKNDLESIENKFIQLSLLMNKKISDLNYESSDDEFVDVSDNEDKKVYYQEENKDIYLSNLGLCLYLDVLVADNFSKIEDYEYKLMFVDNIGKSAYKSANKIRDLIKFQKENIISGLNEIK